MKRPLNFYLKMVQTRMNKNLTVSYLSADRQACDLKNQIKHT